MLSHYRLEMHASFLKDPQATKRMTTEDKENLLEKHAGPVIASAQAKFDAIDIKKIDAYWKQCGLNERSWSQRDDSKKPSSNTPTRRRKGSLGEDELETYTKAFAAQKRNAARFEGKPLVSREKEQIRFRRLNSASPDYAQHHYALGMGYTHVSQRSPPASSRGLPHVRQPSPQPASPSSKVGVSKHETDSSSAARKDPSMQRPPHQQPSHQAGQQSTSNLGGSHESHYQPPNHQAQQNKSTSTNRGASHHDHQHPKPTAKGSSSSSSGAPRLGMVSGDPIANAHLSLPQMPPGLESIFSLKKKKREEMAEQEQRPRKVMKRMEEEAEEGGDKENK